MERFYAHGKLLLSGEYAVLKGALGLAMPVKYGQHLEFTPSHESGLSWQSLDVKGETWLRVEFDEKLQVVSSNDAEKAAFLQNMISTACLLSGKTIPQGRVTTKLEFDRSWGLGSSSTLTHLVASWLGADPFELHSKTQNGSGYDVACAGASSPILFEKQKGFEVTPTSLPEVFEEVQFVHLNQKQLSKPEVDRFMSVEHNPQDLASISSVSMSMTAAGSAKELRKLMEKHEQLMARMLNKPTVQSRLFPDFNGVVKSLGAWGGDFVMVAGEDIKEYFTAKGYHTVIPFSEMTDQ